MIYDFRMRKWVIGAVAVLVLVAGIILAVTIGSSTTTTTQPPAPSISGSIIDSGGKYWIDVTVHNFPTGGAVASCHYNSGYPTGGYIGPSLNITVSSANQDIGKVCYSATSGPGWVGISASGSNYYTPILNYP